MRYGYALILLVRLPALAQYPNPGMTTQQTRVHTEVLEMGHEIPKADDSKAILTFEQSDDPTVIAHPVPQHEPLRAALKAAEKGAHLAKKKQHAEAIAEYRKAVELDPLYFQAWNNLALELNADGKKEEAEQVFRRLIQSNPEHVVVFTNLAALLEDAGRYSEAEAVARQAMKQHSYSFSANFVLGTLLINQGKWTAEAKTKLEYARLRYPRAKSLVEHWPDKAARN